jgi:hypothetical protein
MSWSRLEFVHIPKTGGEAICVSYRNCQWGRYANRAILRIRIPRYPLFGQAKPCSFWHHHQLVEALYKYAKKFCVIRDPVDRLLSEYRWQRLPDDPNRLNKILAQWKTEIEQNPFFSDNHFAPQHLFAEQCDHVLLFDCLEQEVMNLVQQYGIPTRRLVVQHQTSQKYHHIRKDNISPENMAWIQSYYAKDREWYARLKRERNLS